VFKGGNFMSNILKLGERIEYLRKELNEALSNESVTNKQILEYSQRLDELIVKYYDELYNTNKLRQNIKFLEMSL